MIEVTKENAEQQLLNLVKKELKFLRPLYGTQEILEQEAKYMEKGIIEKESRLSVFKVDRAFRGEGRATNMLRVHKIAKLRFKECSEFAKKSEPIDII